MSRLLKTQRNEVFEVIKHVELDPSSFYWEARAAKSESYEILNFKDHFSYFGFLIIKKNFRWEYRPGEVYEIETGGDRSTDWSDILVSVYKWLTNIKNEIDEPDLWANLANTSDSLWDSTNPINENSHFSDSEQLIIQGGIKEIRSFILKTNTTDEEMRLVGNKLDYLIESSKKVGRKDWILMLTGTLLSIATSLALGPATVKSLSDIVGNVFRELYQGLLLIPR